MKALSTVTLGHLALSLEPIMLSHGWINLAPAEKTPRGFRYSLILDGNTPVTIVVISDHGGVKCYVDRKLNNNQLRQDLKLRLTRMLSVHFPLETFLEVCRTRKNQVLLRLARKGWGRIFRSPTPWEDAVKTLCTTNASWPYTCAMCRRLCIETGQETPSGGKTFPSPDIIINKGQGFLEKQIRMGYRSRALMELSEKALSDKASWLLNDQLPNEAELFQAINSWRGFGRYATNHLMMLLGFHRYLPVDRETALNLGVRRRGDSKIPSVPDFADWGGFRFTAYKLTRISKRCNWIGD